MKPERAERATAQLRFADEAVAHFVGSFFCCHRSWGFASLHPRLYAHAALRGLKTKKHVNS
jgi:hypothetical protein